MKGLKVFEKQIIIYALIGTIFFGLFHFFHQDLIPMYQAKYYTSLHIILEFFSISISIAIFTYGWKAFTYSKSQKLLYLSFVFLTVGILDFFHTLTFEGMPFFIAEGSITNSIWFWLVSRLIGTTTIMVILLKTEKRMENDPRATLVLVTGLVIFFISLFIFQYGNYLPVVVIEGVGTTPIKKGIEYFVCFLYLIGMIINVKQYKRTQKHASLYIFLSFYFLLISEIVFTMYSSIYDFDNILGHFFKVIGFIFIIRGFYFSTISEDKLAEESIKKAQQELDEIIREQQGVIYKIKKQNDDFIHLLCDGELLHQMGLNPKHIKNKTIKEMEMAPDEANILLQNYHHAWDTGQKVSFEMDSNGFSLFITLKPIIIGGVINHIIGSATDISKLKHMEEMIRSSEKLGVLGELAAGIAHEVRNPLTTLKGFLQLIKNDSDSQNQIYIKLMLDEVDRIEQITNEFMAVAKPQALLFKPENISEIINQVVSLLQPQALLHGVDIHLEDNIFQKTVFCEKNHLKQVFINLMKNAFEAMPDGGSLSIDIKEKTPHSIIIEFSDTGIGIPEDALLKLGEPFFTMKENGNGLGLMMCKKIIEQHQGKIDVISEMNKGTTFKIILPLYHE
ncbi:MASE3 domain-containing protein [Bacillus marasmi]|uniref:MASE3 domain-containing protein n=1 Tax=Bacillus marasmi TaxID=1926279 RepID=UPI00164DB683|nr:MASE3 domain-containing protein [Bacillus marasmi]